jgi:hypothetical protein
MRNQHWFLFVSTGILTLFFGIMLYVVGLAYTRHSGSTGLDMAAIQKMRYDSVPKHATSSLPPPHP